MANIMLQYGDTTYRTLGYTGRVTNPSLILEGGGQTLYTPLFAVASGAEGRDGNYYYKCCPLAVKSGGTTYRAAYQRRYADSFSRTISTTISHSGQTGTSTTYESKTVTVSGKSSANDIDTGYRSFTVEFGVTFASPPEVTVISESSTASVTNITTTGCKVSSAYIHSAGIGFSATIEATGQIATTTTTYPSETKSATASGDFEYGHTYSSAPSLSADNGVSVSNNSGNASFHASKTLTGTVSFNSSKTLSQAFTVSFSGAA